MMKTIQIEVKKEVWEDKDKINRSVRFVKYLSIASFAAMILGYLQIYTVIMISASVILLGIVILNCVLINKSYDEYIKLEAK